MQDNPQHHRQEEILEKVRELAKLIEKITRTSKYLDEKGLMKYQKDRARRKHEALYFQIFGRVKMHFPEIAQLFEDLWAENLQAHAVAGTLQDENKSLKAELQRKDEALEEVRKHGTGECGCEKLGDCERRYKEVAEQALQPTPFPPSK